MCKISLATFNYHVSINLWHDTGMFLIYLLGFISWINCTAFVYFHLHYLVLATKYRRHQSLVWNQKFNDQIHVFDRVKRPCRPGFRPESSSS